MKLKPATELDRVLIRGAIHMLKKSRNMMNQAGCPKVAAKIALALKSADGAQRHVERRVMRTQEATP